MGLGTGVELEWSIVYHSLLKSGMTPAAAKKRNPKLKAYSESVAKDAKSAVSHVEEIIGTSNLQYAFHSDEYKGGIPGNPEPKTDLVYAVPKKLYKCSVKMRGGIQLASGQGASTALTFRRVVDNMKLTTAKKRIINQLIDDIESMPTRLLSERNVDRIKKGGKAKLINEFFSSGKTIKKDKSYEFWLANNKEQLMGDLLGFFENNPDFVFKLVHEAMTGQLVFRGAMKDAAANYMLTPDMFGPINNAYVRKIMPRTTVDIRAKSRSGITSLAFRFDVR